MSFFSKDYIFPWQEISKRSNIDLTQKIEFDVDILKVQEETKNLLNEYAVVKQHGPYHTGGWNGLCLHAANGDYKKTSLVRGAEYKKTELCKNAPTIEAIIDSFDCDKRRVRLMGLSPGKNIYWHYDSSDSIDKETVRLHIPVVTNPLVEFQICHVDCKWKEGELWYGDFSFPHRVYNKWDKTRIHLILDLVVNQKVNKLFDKQFLAERKKRQQLRKEIYSQFKVFEKDKKLRQVLEGY